MIRILGHPVIVFKDNYYIVKQTIRESHSPNIEVWKKHLYCDTVLKNNGIFYFCELIQDAKIIEDDEQSTELTEPIKEKVNGEICK